MAAKICSLLLLLLGLVLAFLSSPSVADSILYAGGSLLSGQSLTQGNHTLIMQGDCNLVLYHAGRPIWASQTFGWGYNCKAVMQRDGNFVVYTGAGSPVWASGTQRPVGDYVLILQPNGDVVIYGHSIWASGTYTCGEDDSVKAVQVRKAKVPPATSVANVSKAKEGREFGLGWVRGVLGNNRP